MIKFKCQEDALVSICLIFQTVSFESKEDIEITDVIPTMQHLRWNEFLSSHAYLFKIIKSFNMSQIS